MYDAIDKTLELISLNNSTVGKIDSEIKYIHTRVQHLF